MRTLILGLVATLALSAFADSANAQLLRRRRGGCSSGNCNSSLSGCAPGSACASGNANAVAALAVVPPAPLVVAPTARSSARVVTRTGNFAPFANSRAAMNARRAERLNARGATTTRTRATTRLRVSGNYDFRKAAEAALAGDSAQQEPVEVARHEKR